ncbi:FAD-binding oxidoreductase [Cellulomonas sp. URHD0024]|uniref:FAD-binding oxidoreductase n=1 Tax=Cellulomonas sp. URHD0024 TaxID=1302620 RepID=UPI00042A3A5C|nr:FAD-dependent oxidoreductase [Cellulomonas sp. URHD0024]
MPALLTTPRPQHLHLPGDADFDAARAAWNVAVDQRPAAVAVPADSAQVADVVRDAVRAGLRVAPQSTGHNAGPLAAHGLDDTVLLRTHLLDSVHVDPVARIARVGGGVVWQPVVEAAAQHGLAALHGSSPDVGVAGYSLGGGIGWYARSLGMAAHSLTAAEVVTADGSVVRTDAHHEPELFWALRGGGGGFGVVTSLEFRLYPVETAFAGFMLWDAVHAEALLRAWSDWAPAAPDEVTTSFRVLRLPPMPELPPFLRGRHVVVIDGAVLADDESARRILAPLRAVAPEVDTFGRVPAAALTRLHMDPEGPTPGVSDAAILDALPAAAIDAFLSRTVAGTTSPLLAAELRQLGGALGRPDASAALSRLDGQFLAFGVAIAATPQMATAGHAAAADLVGALRATTGHRPYLNFAEDPVDASTAFDATSARRLAQVRAAIDSTGVFVANHRF